MARITRKELKTDKFALEVEHTVDYFDHHRKDIIRYGAAALVVILIGVGIYFYRARQHAARGRVLAEALQVLEAPAGNASPTTGLSFPTMQARDQEAAKRLNEVISRHSSSEEAEVARYTLASMAADQGRLAEAEKGFKDLVDSGGRTYGALARMALAQLYFGSGRTVQGEELLRHLIDKPTALVSKEEATLALARGLARSKPADARKLIEPLRASRSSAVSQAAIQLYAEISQ